MFVCQVKAIKLRRNKLKLIILIYLFITLNSILKLLRSQMQAVKSPFAENIEECRSVMRRLRKKIYKYTSTHKQAKKPRDSVQDILGLLKSRNLPPFVLESIKKRRNFDLGCLKSVMVSPGASLQEITARTNNQEDEIKNLFKQHRTRMQSEKKISTPKFDRKWTASTTNHQEKQNGQQENYSQAFDSSQFRFQNFMAPEVSQFRILSDLEDNNYHNDIDFFGNQDLQFCAPSLFHDEEN